MKWVSLVNIVSDLHPHISPSACRVNIFMDARLVIMLNLLGALLGSLFFEGINSL